MSNFILYFIVNLCLIIYVQSDEVADGDGPFILQSLSPTKNFTINEYKALHLNIYGLENVNEQVPCTGRCSVNGTPMALTCDMVWGDGQKLCLNITITNNITKENNGLWTCDFDLNTTGINPNHNATPVNSTFQLNVIPLEVPTPTAASTTITLPVSQANIPVMERYQIYIIAGVGTLVLLVILGQTIYIIYLRRKLKALHPEALWSKKVEENPDDQARYSKTPCQRAKEEASIPADARESGIYEVLEHLRAPQQPPISTIPKSKSTSATEKPVSTPTPTRSLTNGMSLPWKKKKKKESLMDSEAGGNRKRSTIERMKERPPLPIPGEDVYQALESDDNTTPPAPRRQIPPSGHKKKEAKPKPVKKKEVNKKEVPAKEINASTAGQEFSQPRPKPPVPVPSVIANPKAGPVPADLKNALEMRMRLNTAMQKSDQPAPNPLPKIQPPPLQLQRYRESPKPKQKAWPREPPQPKAEPFLPQEQPTSNMPRAKPWPHELVSASMPRAKPWPQEEVTASLPRKPWPQEEIQPSTQRGKQWPPVEVPQSISRQTPWAQDESTPSMSRRQHWEQEPSIPREKQWPQEPLSPKDKTWPQGPNPSHVSERIGAGQSKVAGFNPGLPPPDAPPAKVRRPPPPVKPKQLHPLPQPPSEPAPLVNPKQLHPLPQPPSEPEPIPDYMDSASEATDDDEEWNYEPLPHYNIYSM